jgi:hypothetical protein
LGLALAPPATKSTTSTGRPGARRQPLGHGLGVGAAASSSPRSFRSARRWRLGRLAAVARRLAAHQVVGLDGGGAFVDGQDLGVAVVLRRAGFLDEAHAAVHLHAQATTSRLISVL